MRSGCQEKLPHAYDLALISESVDGLKGKLETLESEIMESKTLGVNIMKTKESLEKEREFLCAVWRKGASYNFIFHQFNKCLVHMRCSNIRGKQKQGDELKCCVIQDTDTVGECQGIKLNSQSLEAVEFCYFVDTIGTRWGVVKGYFH